MKKQFLPILTVVFVLLLSACCSDPISASAEEIVQPPETTVQEPVETVVTTLPPETIPDTPPPETEAPPPTEPEHSAFFIPGISVEEVIRCFNEVCLDAEFIDSGNPCVLQKWTVPIRYRIYGNASQEDLWVLEAFAAWLNSMEGFPGILPAEDWEYENLRIHFQDAAGMISLMGDQFAGLDGAVTFWYEQDEIYDAIICYRTDIAQYTRNSVILEELYNGLGPIQDTDLREDSIIYSGFSEPQQLTQMDEVILKLLYHPQLICGMDAAECEAVIRQLYY